MLGRFLVILILIPGLVCAGQPSYEDHERDIPSQPSVPPDLTRKTPVITPHCERHFQFKGKQLECDSNLGRDGAALRRFMVDVPDALSELDLYQANLKKIKIAAYLGTAGVVAALLGILVSRPPVDPNSGALRIGGVVMLAGAGLSVNSLLYSLSLIKTNEAHLSNAVQLYNTAHPEQPLQLQFSADLHF